MRVELDGIQPLRIVAFAGSDGIGESVGAVNALDHADVAARVRDCDDRYFAWSADADAPSHRLLLRAGYIVLCDRYIFTAFARDVVRGCPPEWVRGLYDFAALPDLTFFFKAELEVSLQRILDGRPQLKYFEAGMDLRLSSDPYESFRIFQGRMLEQYLAMSTEFNFLVIDANQLVEKQQALVRELIAQKVGLDDYLRAERPPPRPRLTPAPKPEVTEEPVE